MPADHPLPLSAKEPLFDFQEILEFAEDFVAADDLFFIF